jgi:hypothetical protein
MERGHLTTVSGGGTTGGGELGKLWGSGEKDDMNEIEKQETQTCFVDLAPINGTRRTECFRDRDKKSDAPKSNCAVVIKQLALI